MPNTLPDNPMFHDVHPSVAPLFIEHTNEDLLPKQIKTIQLVQDIYCNLCPPDIQKAIKVDIANHVLKPYIEITITSQADTPDNVVLPTYSLNVPLNTPTKSILTYYPIGTSTPYWIRVSSNYPTPIVSTFNATNLSVWQTLINNIRPYLNLDNIYPNNFSRYNYSYDLALNDY